MVVVVMVVAVMETEVKTDGKNVYVITAGKSDISRETAGCLEEEPIRGMGMMQVQDRMGTHCREHMVTQSLVLLEETNLDSSD